MEEYNFRLMKSKLTSELWVIYCEDLGENALCYNSIPLYHGMKLQYL